MTFGKDLLHVFVFNYILQILVLSGKGGVGKSTFTAHLAHALAADESKQVGEKARKVDR